MVVHKSIVMIWLAVALGGALGAMARFGVSLMIPTQTGQLPWNTLTVNIIGSALMGLCYVLLIEKGVVSIQWRPFLMVGILGALTTFSTFALDAILLWQQGYSSQALIYTVASVVTCIAAALLSINIAQKIF